MKFEFDYECDRDWDEMKGGDRQRFCDSCDKHVHHISGMTEKQAREFLERHDYEVCVDFYRDAQGHTVFSERERKLDRQSDGLKQLVASALAIVPLAIGAAFIDFEEPKPAPNVVAPAPMTPPEPLNLAGPAPVIVMPTPNADLDFEPVIAQEVVETPVVPVVEEVPKPGPKPVVQPVRPHVRGKIMPVMDWD